MHISGAGGGGGGGGSHSGSPKRCSCLPCIELVVADRIAAALAECRGCYRESVSWKAELWSQGLEGSSPHTLGEVQL